MTNGYFEVYKEVKKRNSSLSDNDCHARASEIWKNMPDQDKAKYRAMAKKLKGDVKKYNSQGIDLELIEKRRLEIEAAEARETEDINNMVDEALRKKTLTDKVFHICATNYYCITLDKTHITCEMALVSFSLSQGVMDTYCTLIDVGKLPIGFSAEAQLKSKEHAIPLPPLTEGESDSLNIMGQLLVQTKGQPIFCSDKQELQVKSYINQLSRDFDEEGGKIRVYSLTKLLFKLRNSLTENPGFPKITVARLELDRDAFMYVQGIECSFHKTTEEYYTCALAICKRLVYIFCDYCCKHIGVELIPGKHVPKKTTIHYVETSQPKQNAPSLPAYQYEPPKEAEQIIAEERWPSLGGPSRLSASQGAIPRTQQPGGAWGGQNRNINPPEEVVSANTTDPNDWPFPITSSSKKRGGGRRRRN